MEKITDGLIQPGEVLAQIDLRDNMEVADFGSGNGYYSIPLAKIVGQGKIYALDVVKETLEAVESRANLEKIENIETIRCNLEILGASKLEDNSIDLVFMRNILFQTEKKDAVVSEAKRVLKLGGQLVLLEWIPGASMAPKQGWLVSKEEAQQLVEAQGMKLVKELSADNQHYGLIFKK